MAPAAMAWSNSASMRASSSAVAARSEPASPITTVRSAECEQNAATFGPTPRRSRKAKYSANPSNCQSTPARRASSDIASTSARFFKSVSRVAGVAGAMPKPQLPITTVVTPRAGEGEAVESQVSCAS